MWNDKKKKEPLNKFFFKERVADFEDDRDEGIAESKLIGDLMKDILP
jgi:hypothetical protein